MQRLQVLFSNNAILEAVYDYRERLVAIWGHTTNSNEQLCTYYSRG
ncbi:MAG: hypothetical protein BMS9Abin15_0488 [Gammaproteobacteria bacterium]|nr:MAG: hypothetical protein BMS9Abin15_0488 [Gammaproteobacteria bacterium]